MPSPSGKKRNNNTRLFALVWLFSSLSIGAANAGTFTTDIASRVKENQIIASSGNLLDSSRWRRDLPTELRSEHGAPLHRIELDGVVVYLLGSSHVSRASCDDARLLMQHIRPDALFVELCSQRVDFLLSTPAASTREEEITHNNDRIKMHVSHRVSMLYANIQADYAKKLNVTIGGEFRDAFQSALNQQHQFWESQRLGIFDPRSEIALLPSIRQHLSTSASHPRGNRPCAIILGDRPVEITLRRAWESLRLFGKLKLMIALLWSSIQQPSEKEIREWMESILSDRTGENDLITHAMNELGKVFPTLKRVIIDERDEFMVAKLRQTAYALMHSNAHVGEKIIVAVVGAGHCPGLLKKLGNCENKIRPENVLPGLVHTKKRIATDEEISSLVTDIVQFDYSYALENEMQT